jgi:hypothetical protein
MYQPYGRPIPRQAGAGPATTTPGFSPVAGQAQRQTGMPRPVQPPQQAPVAQQYLQAAPQQAPAMGQSLQAAPAGLPQQDFSRANALSRLQGNYAEKSLQAEKPFQEEGATGNPLQAASGMAGNVLRGLFSKPKQAAPVAPPAPQGTGIISRTPGLRGSF